MHYDPSNDTWHIGEAVLNRDILSRIADWNKEGRSCADSIRNALLEIFTHDPVMEMLKATTPNHPHFLSDVKEFADIMIICNDLKDADHE